MDWLFWPFDNAIVWWAVLLFIGVMLATLVDQIVQHVRRAADRRSVQRIIERHRRDDGDP